MTESSHRRPRRGELDSIDRITRSLVARFPELPERVVRHSVKQNHDAFDGSPIRTYLAILTEKAARTELQETVRTNRGAP